MEAVCFVKTEALFLESEKPHIIPERTVSRYRAYYKPACASAMHASVNVLRFSNNIVLYVICNVEVLVLS